jgi:TPR repeat protein
MGPNILGRSQGLTIITVLFGLLFFINGCSSAKENEATKSNIFSLSSEEVAGELKSAGEDEFLAGNYKAARPLLVSAGRTGSLRAVFFLRILTEHGLDGLPPNIDESNRLVALMAAMKDRLIELASKGPQADRHIYQASLALLYFRGQIDGKQNLELALELSRLASASKFTPAMNLAAAILMNPDLKASFFKGLLGGNDNEAFILSLEAAQKNDPLAMGNVGYLYRTGQGVTKDPFQGASWARKAADLPQTTARVLNDLGAIYEEGLAVTMDKAEAQRWYGLAAARGCREGFTNQSRLKSGKNDSPAVLTSLEY